MAHPESSISIELRAVKAELDLAKKTIDRYTHLVTELYDELATLRKGICNTCKTKFVPGAASSLGGRSCSISIPIWRWVFGGNDSAQTQSSPQAISHLRNTQDPLEPSFVPPPATQPQTSAPVVDIANSPVAKPDEADWSVIHNQAVKQTLDIHLIHSLKMKSLVRCVKFSRGGTYLAVGLQSGETYVYEMKSLSYRILTQVDYHAKSQPMILAVQFSPDDKYIATGGYDNQLRIWNIANRHVYAMLKGHTNIITSVDFSPDGRFLLSGSWDGSVRIWCMRDGSSKTLLAKSSNFVLSSAISPDRKYVVAADSSGMLMIWDFLSGQLLQRWKADQLLRVVVFTPDGKGVLGGGKAKILRYWNISPLMAGQSGSRKRELVSGNIDQMECLTFKGHTDTIYAVSNLPGNRVLSCSLDGTARIWDVRSVAWECTLNAHKKPVWAVDASPDGHHLATGSEDGMVGIWRYEQVE